MNDQYSTKCGYISIIGCPNVGKSTLLNLLVGEKLAIVTYRPQTTRNKILGIRTENNAQMIFIDTPGIHRGKNKLNKKISRKAVETLQEADLVLFMADALKPFNPEEEEVIFPLLRKIDSPVILLINKIDLLPDKKDLLPIIQKYNAQLTLTDVFPIAALKGENTEGLIPEIISYLPEGPYFYPEDTLTDRPVRFIVSEIIREKIIISTQEEIPYSTAIIIESFEEGTPGEENAPNQLIKIDASILVERESQKGIIIGKGGKMLKKIGQRAREDIEKYLKAKVFLKLWVKVSKDWSNNERMLKELGY